MAGGSALDWRITGAILVLLGLLCLAAARRAPEYLTKRGILQTTAYTQFGLYMAAAAFGVLGAATILANL